MVIGSVGSEVRSSDKQVICCCIRNEKDVRALRGAGMKEKKRVGGEEEATLFRHVT